MNFKSIPLLVFCSFALSSFAFAQSNVSTNDLDEVISTGKVRTGDDAMKAFFDGDFETAEIEFEKNFVNLSRIENSLQNNLLQAKTDTLGNTLRNGTPQIGERGGVAAPPPPPTITNVSNLNRTVRPDDQLITSGTDKGFQLYMMGLSQIQLGKYDAAKKNMKRAIRLNKKLYDARTRLGLLELHEKNYDKARKQLLSLDKLRKKCAYKCKDKDKISEATLTLAKELARG